MPYERSQLLRVSDAAFSLDADGLIDALRSLGAETGRTDARLSVDDRVELLARMAVFSGEDARAATLAAAGRVTQVSSGQIESWAVPATDHARLCGGAFIRARQRTAGHRADLKHEIHGWRVACVRRQAPSCTCGQIDDLFLVVHERRRRQGWRARGGRHRRAWGRPPQRTRPAAERERRAIQGGRGRDVRARRRGRVTRIGALADTSAMSMTCAAKRYARVAVAF